MSPYPPRISICHTVFVRHLYPGPYPHGLAVLLSRVPRIKRPLSAFILQEWPLLS